MPLFDKKPLVPSKSEPFKNPGLKITSPIDNKKEDLFGGRSQVSRYELKNKFERDPKIRSELARKLKLSPYSQEMNDEIKKMEGKIPERFGSFIDKAEAKRLVADEYWNEKRDANEKSKDGITVQESKEIKKRETAFEFLKRKFGIK